MLKKQHRENRENHGTMVIYMERSSIFEWVNQLLIGGLEHEFYDFPYIGKVIIPTDELYHFSEEKSQHVGKKNIHWVGLQ